MYKSLKNNFPNLYVLLITIAIGIWFRIIVNTFDIFTPKKGVIYYYIIGATLSLTFLYFNDLSLDELHKIDSSVVSGAVSGISSAYEGSK